MVFARIARVVVLAGVLLAVADSLAAAQEKADASQWKELSFLIGTWTGGGSGTPGEGTGGFTFATDLQGRVLVRRNRSDYPATKDRAAFSHEDLMIISREQAGPTKAVYFDNEGHVIHYLVEARGDSVIFMSDTSSTTPRYRLGYVRTAPDSLKLTFDIALPGKSDTFRRYIDASAWRKKPGK